jgi:hypothetical protein
MNDKWMVVLVEATTAIFKCVVAGMVAENMECQVLGRSMAYAMDDFVAAQKEFEAAIEALINLGGQNE